VGKLEIQVEDTVYVCDINCGKHHNRVRRVSLPRLYERIESHLPRRHALLLDSRLLHQLLVDEPMYTANVYTHTVETLIFFLKDQVCGFPASSAVY